MKKILFIIISLFSVQVANAADRVCMTETELLVRKKCLANEKEASFKDIVNTIHNSINAKLGACPQGPSGEAGDAGPSGPEGSSGSVGPKGDLGSNGPKGEEGLPGNGGNDGLTPTDVLSSGHKIFGVVQNMDDTTACGSSFDNAGGTGVISYPLRLPQGASSMRVKIVDIPNCEFGSCISSFGPQSDCPGSAIDPFTPAPKPGVVCVYPTYVNNIENLGGSIAARDIQGSRFGIEVTYDYLNSGYAGFNGVWAYVVP